MRRLPPGSHGIPAEVVARNQRERLISAMTEVCAERGYADTSLTDVVKRAGVSSVTFYKQFADKRECLLAAHDQLLERLLEEVDRARQGEEADQAKVEVTIRTVFSLLAADPSSARLLTVEILAAGSEGAKRHAAAVEAFAARMRAGSSQPLPHADWVLVAGTLTMIGKLVMAGEAARLPELEDELVAMLQLLA
jgi:AcrR family transcriptional regulator